jgi:hypothetical protein
MQIFCYQIIPYIIRTFKKKIGKETFFEIFFKVPEF